MRKIQRLLAAGALVVAAAATGCAGQSAAAACAPVENGVGVCLQGTAIAWDARLKAPHMHEEGGYYGAAVDLARALGVKADIAADKKSVRVNGKQVLARTTNPKGIHEHDAAVYVPIAEFAEAAGYHAAVDTAKHTVSIHK